MNSRPAARDEMQKRYEANNRPADVDSELNNICPDDGSHAAFKCINERERHHGCDGSNTACPKSDADHNGDGPDSNAFSGGTRDKKNARSDTMQLLSKAAIDELVSCEHLAAKILRDKNQAHDNPTEQIAEDKLEKAEVAAIRNARRADDRECAGFSTNNGKSNGPPGNIAVGQKIIAQRSLGFAKP